MSRSLLSATALIALFSLASAQATVGSPNLFECAPAAVQYECSKPPCQIIARPDGDPTSSLHNFGSVNDASGSVSWRPVDQKQGTVVVLYITDSDGVQATSAKLTVNAASDPSNTLGADGNCSSGASEEGDESSASSGGSSTAGSQTASSSSNAADTASSKIASITSKIGDATSKIGDQATSAANAAESATPGSGAAGVFVKSSALAAAIVIAAAALY